MKTLRDVDVSQKRVLLRTDFNVALARGVIQDDFRIQSALPTIRYLQKEGARTLIISHLGRPKNRDDSLSLKPIAQHLEKLLGARVVFFSSLAQAEEGADNIAEGSVALLENIRYEAGEIEGSKKLAERLARLGDVFVNDAFSVSHRTHVSVYVLPSFLPSVAGMLVEKEVQALNSVRNASKRPSVFILGGAKVASKIKVVERLMHGVDDVAFGGLLANSILALKGIAIGRSLFERGIKEYVKNIELTDIKVHLPLDVVVSTDLSGKSKSRITAVGDVKKDEFILDIGPDTVQLFSDVMAQANTIFWNGPMGLFEIEEFSQGTYGLARVLKDSNARIIVGGGDIMTAIDHVGVRDAVSFASTGGGAMLEYLAEGTLPAIDILN